MKERPILFSTPMVEAILKGTKTQTRRLLKPQPLLHNKVIKMPIPIEEYGKIINHYVKKGYTQIYTKGALEGMIAPKCPFGEVGDTIWVRETWQHTNEFGINPQDENSGYIYKASENGKDWEENVEGWKWKPSIFMPRDACRIRLKITDIRAERLHDMPVDDILKEGVNNGVSNPLMGARWENMQRMAWEELWKKINGKESWDSNPWVWVISFEQIKK